MINIDTIKAHTARRVERIDEIAYDISDYPIIELAFNMYPQAFYELFGQDPNTLEGAEEVIDLLLQAYNGDRGITFSKDRENNVIVFSGEDEPDIHAIQMEQVIKAVNDPYVFYELNSAAIEEKSPLDERRNKEHPTNKWLDLVALSVSCRGLHGWINSTAYLENLALIEETRERLLNSDKA